MSKRTVTILSLVGVTLLCCVLGLAAVFVHGETAGSAATASGMPTATDTATAGSASQSASSAAPAVTASSPSVQESQATDNSPAKPSEEQPETGKASDKKLIAIDAGHQSAGDSGLEPIGPGASDMKARVSSGTVGRYTGLPEYQINLKVALKLQAALEAVGYDVIMIRTTNDVDISNSERAQVANEADADAFIRIHANGADSSSENGVLTICQTKSNPFNGAIYAQCRALSRDIVTGVAAATGAADRGIWETDTMSGINWCTVPVTILEMGYMTNEKEDRLLSTDAYQDLIVQGIVAGLASFFKDSQSAAPPTADTGNSGLSALKEKIDGSIGGLSSQWDVYVERLSDGANISSSHSLPQDGRMVAASLIKIYIMGAAYEQVSLGKLDEEKAAADLELMITVSDNDATNRLIRLLGDGDSEKGFERVNTYAAGLGYRHTELNRLMLDWDGGLENYTSAGDCARLLRLIYTGRCVSAGYSEKMMALLKAQEKSEGLKWSIPDDVAVASKPGFISGVSVGDVGIVFSAHDDYILCVICNKPHSDDGARQEISDISCLVFDYFAGQ